MTSTERKSQNCSTPHWTGVALAILALTCATGSSQSAEPWADAIPCGSLRSGHPDYEALYSFMPAAGNAMQRWADIENDPSLDLQDRALGVTLVMEVADINQRVAGLAGAATLRTRSETLRAFYHSVRQQTTEFSEIHRAGAILLEARRTNNLDLLISAGASLISKEAKHLVLPVLTRVELELRVQRFVQEELPRHWATRQRFAADARELGRRFDACR